MTPSQDEILKWMTNRGYYLRHDHLLQRGDAGDGKGPDVLHPSYSLFFTDGGSGTRRIGVFTGRFDWALQQAYHAAGEDWEQRKPERFLSFIRNDEIHAQVPCTLRDDEAIAIDTFLRNIGKLTEDEEVATTEVMTSRHGYKLDDPALIQLVMAEDATTVEASVAVRGTQVVVGVRDDGVGMPETDRRSGLANLAARARERGGTFRIDAVQPHGTEVRWSVPWEAR